MPQHHQLSLSRLAANASLIAVAVACGWLLAGCADTGAAAGSAPSMPSPPAAAGSKVFAPYQDMSLTALSAGVTQNNLPTIASASGILNFSMAFITSAGNGCNPEWGGVGPIANDARFGGYISQLRALGGDVIISFGGEAADNTAADGGGPDYDLAWNGGCTSAVLLEAAYQSVIDRYSRNAATPVALDFDVEGDALAAPVVNGISTIDLRNQALAALAAANPGLQISYTIPASENGLQAPEIALLQSALKYGVPLSLVNVMLMDFGAPIAAGQYGGIVTSAAAASLSQLRSLGINAPLGITVLIGTNDQSDETFLLSDAQTVAAYAHSEPNVARLSFWEVARDNGSCGDAPADLDDDNCSSVSQADWAFARIFETF